MMFIEVACNYTRHTIVLLRIRKFIGLKRSQKSADNASSKIADETDTTEQPADPVVDNTDLDLLLGDLDI